MPNLVAFLIPFILAAFWLWMFWDFVNNPEITGQLRMYWLIAFIFLNVLTAGYYYFTEYNHHK